MLRATLSKAALEAKTPWLSCCFVSVVALPAKVYQPCLQTMCCLQTKLNCRTTLVSNLIRTAALHQHSIFKRHPTQNTLESAQTEPRDIGTSLLQFKSCVHLAWCILFRTRSPHLHFSQPGQSPKPHSTWFLWCLWAGHDLPVCSRIHLSPSGVFLSSLRCRDQPSPFFTWRMGQWILRRWALLWWHPRLSPVLVQWFGLKRTENILLMSLRKDRGY